MYNEYGKHGTIDKQQIIDEQQINKTMEQQMKEHLETDRTSGNIGKKHGTIDEDHGNRTNIGKHSWENEEISRVPMLDTPSFFFSNTGYCLLWNITTRENG